MISFLQVVSQLALAGGLADIISLLFRFHEQFFRPADRTSLRLLSWEGMKNHESNFTEEQVEFYRDALEMLNENKIPFLVGGAFALGEYTGIARNTKDIDLFCKAGDYQQVLKFFTDNGYEVEVTDARWIAKVFKKGYFIDIIFNTTNNLCPVDDGWFQHAISKKMFGVPVRCVAPEELVWCKTYIQDRGRFDGADILHIILKQGKDMDWERLLGRMELHWHLLLAHLLNFQFVYPADRDIIPRWLFGHLLEKAHQQYDIPASKNKVCRGPIIDHNSYEIDIMEWDYKVVTLNTV